jgi:hypothetical protein
VKGHAENEKMRTADAVSEKLEQVARKLTERGQDDLASEVTGVVRELRQDHESPAPSQLLTTGEAAALLEVRSVFTIKRWARDGILDGFRRGGRIMVTRESVERLLHAPKIAEEEERESDLAALDAGDEPVLPTGWSGRKPWESRASIQR